MTTEQVIREIADDLYDCEEFADVPSSDLLLEAARKGRAAARSDEAYDNPYPPGSSEYMWLGGAFYDVRS